MNSLPKHSKRHKIHPYWHMKGWINPASHHQARWHNKQFELSELYKHQAELVEMFKLQQHGLRHLRRNKTVASITFRDSEARKSPSHSSLLTLTKSKPIISIEQPTKPVNCCLLSFANRIRDLERCLRNMTESIPIERVAKSRRVNGNSSRCIEQSTAHGDGIQEIETT